MQAGLGPLSLFFFVDLSNIRILRLFHDSTAKEIHSCISTPGQYCVVNFLFMVVILVNETNRTYPNLVAKIQVYMSNKTQNSNYFSLLQKSGSYKNMLNFMTIVYMLHLPQNYHLLQFLRLVSYCVKALISICKERVLARLHGCTRSYKPSLVA